MLVGKPEGKRKRGDLDINGKIELKWTGINRKTTLKSVLEK
jgi:hypothetical protein